MNSINIRRNIHVVLCAICFIFAFWTLALGAVIGAETDIFLKIKEVVLTHNQQLADDIEPVAGKEGMFVMSDKALEEAMNLYEDGPDFFYKSIQGGRVMETKDKSVWRRFMSSPKPYRKHLVLEDTLTVEQIEADIYRAIYIMDLHMEGRGDLRFKVTMNFRQNKTGELKILNCLQEEEA